MMSNKFEGQEKRSLEEDRRLASLARMGDRGALAQLIGPLQGPVFNIARRMVWEAEDAQDVTQEALLRIVIQLGKYRGDSLFNTWAYRVAVNAILNTRTRRMEVPTVSFEQFGDALERALANAGSESYIDPAAEILAEEVKLSCMTGMLLCLNRPARLAYILGEIFEIDHVLAADLCGIAPAAFRQRLSRARKALHDFVKVRCGRVGSGAKCHCTSMVGPAVANGRINPQQLSFVDLTSMPPAGGPNAMSAKVRQLDAAVRAVELFREHPSYQPVQGFNVWLNELLSGTELSGILEPT